MILEVERIGVVHAAGRQPIDDASGGSEATIESDPHCGKHALVGLEDFSHAEIPFHFHLVGPARTVAGAPAERA